MIFKKRTRQYPIPLLPSHATTGSALFWIMTPVSCLLVLLLFSFFSLFNLKRSLILSASTSIMIQIPFDTHHAETMNLFNDIQNDNTVQTFHLLSHTEIKKLIAPWISETNIDTDIALPKFVSVDFSSLQDRHRFLKQFKERYPHFFFEISDTWASQVKKMIYMFLFLLSFIAVMLTLIGSTGLFFSTLTTLTAEKTNILILKIIGASHQDIMKSFRKHVLVSVIKSASLGLALALFIIVTSSLFISFTTHTSIKDLTEVIQFWSWGPFLITIPPFITLLSSFSLGLCASRILKKFEHS